MQLDQYVSPEQIFSEYAYFSSFSDSWLEHAADYTAMIIERLGLTEDGFVVELASNDGYLLRNFVERKIPCLGVEPAANVARAAEELGIPTLVEFFGADMAKRMKEEGQGADLIIGNNVLAQVPDLNDFVEGIRILLKPGGVATLEFPHLLRLFEECQYDTIYHEHFCYFSWVSVETIFAAHGLRLFDVEELRSHGGSLRVYACHEDDDAKPITDRSVGLRDREVRAGYMDMATYDEFGERVRESKRALLSFLIDAKRNGKTVAGYGAPGKGNTLLNYCGIRTDFIDFTVDRNPYKHGRMLPGTHIPVFPVEIIDEARPDYLLILPWNLKDEIVSQMAHIREWGGRFVVPIPTATVIE
jgi:SAM-dependent methyltransferase